MGKERGQPARRRIVATSIQQLAASAAAAFLLLFIGSAPAQERPLANARGSVSDRGGQEGVVVEERGPIHEAFAQPQAIKPGPMPIVPKKPPQPVPELPPDQKPQGVNVQWIPGYWSWDLEKKDFIWVSGFWRDPPPGRNWAAGHWVEANGGWQYVNGFWAGNNQQQPPQILPQPPASIDNGPSVPQSGDNTFYVPGGWVFRNGNWLWRPGFWSQSYNGWVWTPGTYTWSPSGYTYVDGYWDYPLEDRGLLFAPVSFTFPWWNTPGWSFQPWFGINPFGLYGSLFVNPFCRHFFFGNFNGAFFVGLGFHPWSWWGARFHDPLFSFHTWRTQWNPGWSRGFVTTAGHGNLITPLNRMPTSLGMTHQPAAHSPVARTAAAHSFSTGSVGRQSFYTPTFHHEPSGNLHFSTATSAPHFSSPSFHSGGSPSFHGGSSFGGHVGGGGHSGGGGGHGHR
jgi:hypothetical protein